MNIFLLSRSLVENARSHCDKHIVKMPVESVQMLCTALHLTTDLRHVKVKMYKPVHPGHPCSVWVRASLDNWLYLKRLSLELCGEYTRRYGKTHSCEELVRALPNPSIESVGLTPFARAVKDYDDLRALPDPVACYRHYYVRDKRLIARWDHSEVPEWYLTLLTKYRYPRPCLIRRVK